MKSGHHPWEKTLLGTLSIQSSVIRPSFPTGALSCCKNAFWPSGFSRLSPTGHVPLAVSLWVSLSSALCWVREWVPTLPWKCGGLPGPCATTVWLWPCCAHRAQARHYWGWVRFHSLPCCTPVYPRQVTLVLGCPSVCCVWGDKHQPTQRAQYVIHWTVMTVLTLELLKGTKKTLASGSSGACGQGTCLKSTKYMSGFSHVRTTVGKRREGRCWGTLGRGWSQLVTLRRWHLRAVNYAEICRFSLNHIWHLKIMITWADRPALLPESKLYPGTWPLSHCQQWYFMTKLIQYGQSHVVSKWSVSPRNLRCGCNLRGCHSVIYVSGLLLYSLGPEATP